MFDLTLTARSETRPVRITMSGIRIAEEENARLLLIVQDLTEEERLHAARRVSEQRFHDLVQELDAIVWEADAATLKFTFVSQRAETIQGYATATGSASATSGPTASIPTTASGRSPCPGPRWPVAPTTSSSTARSPPTAR
jgi:hypothetical protein